MVSIRPLDREYVPTTDRAFVAYAERLFRGAGTGNARFDAAAFERRLHRRFPYAAVIAASLSSGPGAVAASDVSWRIYRDGGPSQALW